jgi:hypothetical protein
VLSSDGAETEESDLHLEVSKWAMVFERLLLRKRRKVVCVAPSGTDAISFCAKTPRATLRGVSTMRDTWTRFDTWTR